MTRDDLGHPHQGDGPAQRVVSLVPSITEALASVRPAAVVGATEWCTHPPALEVARVRGTKNPDRDAIVRLVPDLVVANKEENRELDVRRLRASGVPVWVTDIETVPQAIGSLERLFDEALTWPRPDWLAQARDLWCGPLPDPIHTVAIPIWRDPWMVVGSRTFTGDLVRRLGLRNVYDEHPDRYPHVDVADIDKSGADLVLLPDEPYEFTRGNGPEAFSRTPTRLVSGRLLTWYGPSLIKAHEMCADQDTRRNP
ncbi:helical backbone metal receptor [Nocardioides sp.]|uniref:helical backbone metal receptor n=1 Tax=Nocardioides sp. TaxID=35761 RepID=UPI0026114B9C|nr:helical backbone metal receptor [Nocardioides sp.]MDI6908182.1 helical backbone metal receptor [Nocardioides sp.]